VQLQQTRIYLWYHDLEGGGYLREAELERYVAEMLKSLPPLAELEPSMEQQYKRIAVSSHVLLNVH
jgi:hypothetical protein